MYKLVLCLRYLRTRWIALASIVSVTLGVATLIVVNSVMHGFATEMRERVRGVLAHIMIEGPPGIGFEHADLLMDRIRTVAGDKIEAMTPVIETFGMLSFDLAGGVYNQPVHVIAVDPAGRAAVGKFAEYLQDVRNRADPAHAFDIRDDVRAIVEERAIYEKLTRARAGQGASQRALPGRVGARNGLGRLGDHTPAEAGRGPENMDPAVLSEALETLGESLAIPGVATPNAPRLLPEFRDAEPSAEPGRFTPASQDEPPALLREPAPLRSSRQLDAGGDFVGAPSVPDAAQPPSPKPLMEFDSQAAPQHTKGVIIPWLIASIRVHNEDIEVIRPGAQVRLILPSSSARPEPRFAARTVVDRFKSGMSEYDQTNCYMDLADMQELLGMGEPNPRVTSIQIRLKDYADAPTVVRALERLFVPPRFRVVTWEQKQGALLGAVAVEGGILNVLLFMIIAVAGFGILAIFFMIVVEKTRDIGILKSLGASDRGIQSIFLGYGLGLGVLGSGIGMTIGLLIVIFLDKIERFLSWATGHDVFDRNLYYFDKIPTVIDPWNIAWIVGGAILIAVAASVLPARRAAALRPVESLRYE